MKAMIGLRGAFAQRAPIGAVAMSNGSWRRLAPLLALVVSSSVVAQTPRTADVLIRDARVFTMTSRGTLENTDVLVRGGRINAIGTRLTAPAGVTTVEANGRALTPGIF